ncbi:MAG: cell division protein FtsA [Candidatus Binatia bacterium]
MAKSRPILAGLDIGTQRVAVVVAERTPHGLEVLGVGTALSRGMKAGRVVDVEKTTDAIGIAVGEAEMMAGTEVKSAIVSLSGDHLQGTNSHGVAAVDNGEVSARAAHRVIDAARAVPLPPDQEIQQIICRDFIVDGQSGIADPVGMNGVRLEVNLHLVSGAETAVANIYSCCNRAGLSVEDVMASSLSAGEATLQRDETDLGVALIDLGAGTADMAIYQQGSVAHTEVTTVAGDHITSDLSRCLETSVREAEAAKKRYGRAYSGLVDRSSEVEIAGVGGRPPRIISQGLIADIIESRLEEIFENQLKIIEASGHGDKLTSGVVLTGGCSMMPGIVDVASRVLGMPVRVGEPVGIAGLTEEVDDPSWATVIGLVRGMPINELVDGVGPTRLLPKWLQRKWNELF